VIPVRRHVLAALALGIENGNDEVARRAAGRADWVLRRSVRRELEHALIDAALLTREHVSAADDEAMRHVQRVAALNVAGRLDIDVGDRAAVADAYRTLPTAAPPAAPVATILASGALAAFLLLLVWLAISVRRPHHMMRPAPVIGSGAFFHGGTPARDAELEAFLVDNLTQLVIETDADRRGSHEGAPRARRVQELRESPVIAARGPGLAHAWRDLIDELDRWAELPVGGPHVRQAVAELGRRAQAVNEQLAALGLGYYLQADALLGKMAHAIVFVYRVEDVAFVRAGGERRRVLDLRRLDHLNLDLALLGRQTDESADPVVLLDRIDNFVGEHVLPAFEGSSYQLGDASFAGSSHGRELAIIAGDAIHRELVAAGAVDRASVTRIVTATVRRHEARHGIDLDRERPLRYPVPLFALAGARGPANLRTELELAGYLSQIGNDPATPQLSLWNLASQGFNRDRWGTAEGYAAVIVIEGIARKLGIKPDRPIVIHGHLERDRLAALAAPLAAQGSEKLRTAARLLWMDLYGEPMLPITDVR